jgi:hypothetical protein
MPTPTPTPISQLANPAFHDSQTAREGRPRSASMCEASCSYLVERDRVRVQIAQLWSGSRERWGLGSGGLVVLFTCGVSLLWSASVGVKGGVKGGNGFGVDGEGGS